MRFHKEIYGDPIVNAIIAKVEGQKTHSRPYAFVEGENKYSHITGGIALPKIDKPGYLLTVAVDFDSHSIECIDEFESMDAYALIRKAQDIQTEYGPGVIQNWWGDPKALMSLVNELNKDDNRVYISAPIDSEQPDAFGIYLSRIVVGLSPTNQTFFIHGCDILRNALQSFVPVGTAKADDYPAIYTAGSIIHTVLTMQPWEYAIDTVDMRPTTIDEIGIYGREKDKRAMYRQIYGMRS